jgi:hybrid cluster-associated redox disulfide protein
MRNEITKNTTLAEVLKHPEAMNALARHNLPCLHCPMAAYEMSTLKVGEVAKMYGIDIESLLKDLNKGVKK